MQLHMPALGPPSLSPSPQPQPPANFTHLSTQLSLQVVCMFWNPSHVYSSTFPADALPRGPDGSLSDVSPRARPGLLLRLRERAQKFTPHLPWAICRSRWEAGQESGPNFPRNQNTEGKYGAELSGTSSHTLSTLRLESEWKVIANSHETIPSPPLTESLSSGAGGV